MSCLKKNKFAEQSRDLLSLADLHEELEEKKAKSKIMIVPVLMIILGILLILSGIFYKDIESFLKKNFNKPTKTEKKDEKDPSLTTYECTSTSNDNTLGLTKKNVTTYNFKDNLRYFSLLGIGIFVSITIGSKVVLYLYNMYQSFMLILFIGLLSCSLIKLYINTDGKNNILIVIITCIITILFKNVSFPIYIYKNTFNDNLYVFILGIIESLSLTIPGLIGSSIYLLLGTYNLILNIYSHIFNITSFYFFSALLIGLLINIRLIYYLLKKHPLIIKNVILIFSISSLIYLIIYFIRISELKYIFVYMILFLLGFISSVFFTG